MESLLTFVERLNFGYPKTMVGAHFEQILMVLSVLFGLSLILFSWRHHKFYMGFVGVVMGCWGGLLLKGETSGGIAPFFYIFACAILGLFIAVYFEKLMGILLGGVTAACVAYVFSDYLAKGQNRTIIISILFLFGGGLGAITPKLFFVLNSSLIGSVFVVYGFTPAVRELGITGSDTLLHLVIFLPLFIFGIIYQLMTAGEEPGKSKAGEKEKAAAKPDGKNAKPAAA